MKSFARYVILAPLSLGLAAPAFAQQVPSGQSCGGLLCDMGMFGHKVPVNSDGTAPSQAQLATAEAQAEASDPHRLPCNDFLCRAFGGKSAAAPPPQAPVTAAELAPEPVKTKKSHRKKHVAKAENKDAETKAAADAR